MEEYKRLYDYFENKLKLMLTSKRFEHSQRVVETSLKISQKYVLNKERVALAALVHDRGKEISSEKLITISMEAGIIKDDAEKYNPELLHGPVGSYLLKTEDNISDVDLLNAVCYHTTGRPGMTDLEKVIFLADLVEPGRDYPLVDTLRKLVFKTPDLALVKSLDWTLEYLMRKGWVIHPLTVKTRNYYLVKYG